MTTGERLVVVSNRLPVVVRKDGDRWRVNPGSGGLISAMAPVLRNRGGVWIGWAGTTEEVDLGELLPSAGKRTGYDLLPVFLTPEEEWNFYYGFSNEIIWPLFHDLQTRCNMDPTYWTTYRDVNRKFAGAVLERTKRSDVIWVHDYHLMSVAHEIRKSDADRRLAFFLHIPFPCPDVFLKLPWRAQLLTHLLEYDLIGFQTQRDRHNFVQCLQTLVQGVSVRGKGRVVRADHGSRSLRLGVFPISIDYRSFADESAGEAVSKTAWEVHANLPERQIVLGIDRLDYTKGIPYRLEAFRRALERHPDLHNNVTLFQVVVPSREDIPEYRGLKIEIESLVGEINGRHTRAGWVPIHYIFRRLERTELLAYYRTAEIALITPLKDGMNLVAKEYCACSTEERGVLILSEFAGAAAQLQRGAILVNPYDTEGVGEAIYHAWRMEEEERRRRMRKLRHTIRKYDVFWWVDSFLQAAVAKDLDDFPPLGRALHPVPE